MTNWAEEDLAYDGSGEPQTRELTPRERDILCRIIVRFSMKMRELLGVDPDVEEFQFNERLLTESTEFAWMDIHPTEVQTIFEMHAALNPRKS